MLMPVSMTFEMGVGWTPRKYAAMSNGRRYLPGRVSAIHAKASAGRREKMAVARAIRVPLPSFIHSDVLLQSDNRLETQLPR